jgi:Predicted membrane protein
MPGPHLISRGYRYLQSTLGDLYREIAKFGIVGLSALVVDIGLFNLLRFAGGECPLFDKPLTAKIISVSVATTVAYAGNRFWTFRHRGRTHMGKEYLMFFGLNGVAMLIAVACLWFSHYVLGLTSALARQHQRERGRPGSGHAVPLLVLPQVGLPGGGPRRSRR